jgi:hypothetical protein
MIPQIPIAPVRWKAGEDRTGRSWPKLAPDHPAADDPCLLCDDRLGDGQAVTLIILGPGGRHDDADDQLQALNGRWHASWAVLLHSACAGVRVDRER